MASATHKLAKLARTKAKNAQKAAKDTYGAGSDRHKAAIADVKAAEKSMKAEEAAQGMSFAEAAEKRAETLQKTAGKSGAALFDLHTEMRAYGNVMREHTGQQKGQGTSYLGPGVQVYLDDGRPALTDKGVVKYDIDTDAYLKRFIPQFTPTAEQLERAGGPGGWAQGLLGGGEDYTYLTPWQQTNIQTLLGAGEDISPQDASLEIMGLPESLRTDWRQETWGDVFNERTGLWERADPTKRATAVQDQLRRYEAGLFNPYTGQPEESTGPAPWENVRRIWEILGDDTTTTNLNNRTQVTSPFQHPYAADSYTVPHMQTGAEWEGLGAEYQPGTVEGLGLLAGEPSAPYEPLARSLLDASPSFMGTPSGFEPMNFEGGLAGETETSNNAWTPTWQFTNVNGAQQYGYFNQGGQWVRGGDQR